MKATVLTLNEEHLRRTADGCIFIEQKTSAGFVSFLKRMIARPYVLKGMHLRMSCGNKGCINPDHMMFPGLNYRPQEQDQTQLLLTQPGD